MSGCHPSSLFLVIPVPRHWDPVSPYDGVIPVPRHWFLSKRVSSQCPDTGISFYFMMML
ncbi:hypothetical protein [Wolbachia endosymbiont (group A) of Apoderus coryli]|uniref:hypothetical protein n=1 Tax=Wolbachia endosymbiont (group A) of Apoderus coryli TaxID=2953980 RepID=UPI002230938A|nr:hypothetical protein [Wolbachia endosymbiont (group A) of Apoderus coryli]